MAKSVDKISEKLLHRLVDTKEDTLALFRNEISKMNEADKNYFIDFLIAKFNEYNIDDMLEYYYRDAFEDVRIIKTSSFGTNKKSIEDIYNNNDEFINQKREQLEAIKNTLIELQKKNLLARSKSSDDIYSFKWIHSSGTKGLKKFYDLLMNTTPEIISKKTNYADFKKAFSNIQLSEKNTLKITWCVNGRNGLISKQTLFYLIEELVKSNLIVFSYNKCIPYIFIDREGNPIKNISVSTSSKTEKPTRKEDIDSLIQTLKKNLN